MTQYLGDLEHEEESNIREPSTSTSYLICCATERKIAEMQFKSSVMQTGRDDHNFEDHDNDDMNCASTKFYFQQRRGRIDLRTLSQMDLDKIVRDVDIDVLQMHLENITFSNLKEEDLRFLTDPLVIKLFRTSQLMIEYLLYAQEQLASNLQQMANKYGSKKRSLAKKRIELAELQESTKHLRHEVKTKKNSVAALENLLKTASHSRHRRRNHKVSTEDADDSNLAPPIRQSVIQFFVSGPEGLCVEFNERVTCSILQLTREVRKAFVTKQDKRSKQRDNNIDIRLVYHGRILLEDGSIESNSIRPGDTVVAIIEKNDSDDCLTNDPLVNGSPPVNSASSDMMDLLKRQQDTMKNVAQEMRLGWESALQALSTSKQQQSESKNGNYSNDQDLLVKMDARWERMESSMRGQFSCQLEEYKGLIAAGQKDAHVRSTPSRSGMQVGDLESDTEDLLVTRDEFAGRLRDSSDRIGKLDSEIVHLKKALIKQSNEMDHLMKQVGEGTVVHKTVVEYVNASSLPPMMQRDAAHTAHAPMPDSLPVDVAVRAIEAKVAHAYDTEVLQMKSPQPTPAPLSVASEKRSKVVFSDTEEEIKVKNLPSAAAAAPHTPHSARTGSSRVEPVQIDALQSKKEEKGREVLDDGCLDIVFPFQWNLDLIPDLNAHKLDPSTGRKIESMSIRVLQDITPDDLIFELRHYIATEADVPLKRVSLVINRKVVTMGIDLDEDSPELTAKSAATLALSGQLIAKISKGKPVNNAQLDQLVSHLEGQQLLGLTAVPSSLRASKEWISPSNNLVSSSRQSIAATERKRRSWDDGESNRSGTDWIREGTNPPPIEDMWGSTHEMSLRKSLSATLNDLSDVEGLTDDELKIKTRALRRSTEQVPEDLSKHLKEYRGSVAGAMAAAAADSGSEDFYTETDRLGRARGSTVSLVLSDSAHASRQLLGSSQSLVKNSTEFNPRLSLPSMGWGRRSVESFDDDVDFTYGQKSGTFRRVEEDSAPMMASLTLPMKISLMNKQLSQQSSTQSLLQQNSSQSLLNTSTLQDQNSPSPEHQYQQNEGNQHQKSVYDMNTSLLSAVDMRASYSIPLSDQSESSGAENGKESKYSSFINSVAASNTAKKIPFGSDDTMEGTQGLGVKSIHSAVVYVAGEKGSAVYRNEGKGSKNSPTPLKSTSNYRDVREFNEEDEEEDIEEKEKKEQNREDFQLDPLRGGISSNTGTLSGLGLNAGRYSQGEDLGATVSTLGNSGQILYRMGSGSKAEAKGGLGRFDFDRTIDSEGDMLKARDIPMSQVMMRADAYEKQFSRMDSNSRNLPPSRAGREGSMGIGSGSAASPLYIASPMSRGSSVNSGVFDNLVTSDGVQDFGPETDGNNSLGLSDSEVGFSDNIYLPSHDTP